MPELSQIYAYLTPCPEGKCLLTSGYDPELAETWVQHGKNEEHRLVVSTAELVRTPIAPGSTLTKVYQRHVVDWVNAVHKYESRA